MWQQRRLSDEVLGAEPLTTPLSTRSYIPKYWILASGKDQMANNKKNQQQGQHFSMPDSDTDPEVIRGWPQI